MARKAGVISIDVQAGTAKFVLDMEKAKGAVREFGASSRSSMAASSAALRELEGNFGNNTRAVSRFLTQTLGLGPILSAAFPLIGGLAFGGMVVDLGKKVADFFKSVQEAPAKIDNAFRQANNSIRLTNDELRISNDRLESEIAKLQGREPNNLKMMLDEARKASDQLGESLGKNLQALDKLLKDNAVSGVRRFFGEAGTGGLQKIAETLETGVGAVTDQFSEKISKETNAKKQQALQTEENTRILRLYQKALEDVSATVATPHLDIFHSLVNGAPTFENTDVQTRGAAQMARYLNQQMEQIKMQGRAGDLDRSKPGAEQEAKDRQTAARLQQELAMAKAEQLGMLEKIDAEEVKALQNLSREHEYNIANVDLVKEIYDAKRLKTYTDETERLTHAIAEINHEWAKRAIEADKPIFSDQIDEGKKKLEEMGKAAGKIAAEIDRVNSNAANAAVRHAVAMVGYKEGSGDPVALLALQQDLKRQEILDRYVNSLKMATSEIEKAAIIRQKNLALDELDYEMQERKAAEQQRGVRDFFLEMQRQAQTAGNILYEAMHSALDRTSDELAKLLTGQKTNFGKMLQDIGTQMVRESIKSGLQTGLGKLAGILFPKHGAATKPQQATLRPGDPGYVYVVNMGGGQGQNYSPVAGFSPIGGPAAGSAVGAALSAVGGVISGFANIFAAGAAAHSPTPSVTSSIKYMAEGGDVDPGKAYVVGDGGEPEFFTPSRSGTITPMHKMSGGHTYYVDARGADIGVEHRVSRAIEMAHSSAISTSVRASAEHAKRTPKRI